MAKPIWITPAGNLGTIPEGIFFQLDLLASVAPIAFNTICTATTSGTNYITCASTSRLYSGQSITFNGNIGGLIKNQIYYVLSVISATQFTVAETIFATQPIALSTALGNITAQFSGVECTATTNADQVVCTTTAGLYKGLEVYFSGQVFGGVTVYTRYFVASIVNSTTFTVSMFENGTGSPGLSNASGSMTATFNQHPMFIVQAGALPPGIQCSDNGLLEGTPKAVASLQGVPFEVGSDITSKFTVRAYTKTQAGLVDSIAERTFSLTVTGQDAPEFITPPGTIAEYFDGSQVTDLQIEYTDTDPSDIVTIRVAGGSLPPGLTLSPTGLISGFIAPLSTIEETAGFSRDGQGFAEYPFDFSTRSIDITYEFLLEISDGKNNDIRSFNIQVYSRNNMTADNTTVTADNTFVTADVTPVRTPILLNLPGSIGYTRSDNFFAYKFNGLDLDGDPITYAKVSGDFPPGLTLDPESGWLYGFIPDLGLTDLTYSFDVVVYKTGDPLVFSTPHTYTLEVVGNIDTEIIWLTPSDLGDIDCGSISTLYVLATNQAGIDLQYRLKLGDYNLLPQGLTLLPSGEIAGRVSFDCFMLDNNTTTFDVTFNDLAIAGTNTQTTFDRTFTFTVEAYGGSGLISVFKTFTITIGKVYTEPYENLYVEAMPTFSDRDTVNSLLQDTDIFPEELLYRPTDPYFGVATNITYWHAYGLTSATYADYVSSLYKNHYWKNLTLGQIETAQALDDSGNIIYEVVYSRVIDNLVNNEGESISKDVLLAYPVNPGDSTEIDLVYPNSLQNMRDQVIDTVGQVSNLLPRWMLSKQSTGQVLGFTPAWVIAYTKPNKSKQVAYNIQTMFNQSLNVIDFEVDRYELDKLLTKNWDSETQSWIPRPPTTTTFDIYEEYLYNTPSLDTTGQISDSTSYTGDNETLEFLVELLPSTGTVVVTVDAVIQEYATDYEVNYGDFPNYVIFAVPPANGTAIVINQISDISVTDMEGTLSTQTTFDQGSMQFIDPVDMYSMTQAYDKYLVFPKRTILG